MEVLLSDVVQHKNNNSNYNKPSGFALPAKCSYSNHSKVQNGFSVFKLTSSDCIGIYYKDRHEFSWLKMGGLFYIILILAGKVGEEYHLYISNFQ